MVAVAGLPASGYAWHAIYIGAPPLCRWKGLRRMNVVQEQNRWEPDVHEEYVRSHGVDAPTVSDMLVYTHTQLVAKPGKGLEWYRLYEKQVR